MSSSYSSRGSSSSSYSSRGSSSSYSSRGSSMWSYNDPRRRGPRQTQWEPPSLRNVPAKHVSTIPAPRKIAEQVRLVPTEPPKPRTDLASKLLKLYEKKQVTPFESKPSEKEKIYFIPKNRVPKPFVFKTPTEKFFPEGFLKLTGNKTLTMAIVPSVSTAKKILRLLNEDSYTVGYLLYCLPVIVSWKDDLYRTIQYLPLEWGVSPEKCLLTTVDSEYQLPIMSEDSCERWYQSFESAFTGPLEIASHLEVPSLEWLKKGYLRLEEPPSEKVWEAFRILYYTINKSDPIQPISYPVVLTLEKKRQDLSCVEPYGSDDFNYETPL